ncbi:MAG TPA: uracil-DNA glycosylase family protein [Desulfobacterales bacterium]|nr:uracil-DNA glycosylase family protein [Desulfobacterales bacterium]
MVSSDLIAALRRLARGVDRLRFASPVAYVYNPLVYAREPAERYVERFTASGAEVVFLGMNPGPWGMAQTGVPFGEVAAVRDWLGIEGRVTAPAGMHPRVPVRGFACTRSEVSGRRLWGLARERFGDAEAMAGHWFVANYCPLLFLDADGCNITPDKLAATDRAALFPLCDRLLATALSILRPRWAVGVGTFTRRRLEAVAAPLGIAVTSILHPSPASPAANRGWARQAKAALRAGGIWLAG